jgi:transcriptional regulator with XRE-family HTH domain
MNTIAKIKYVKTLHIQHADTGREARLQRTKRNLSLRSVAKAMCICAPYLCDLELGRRKWSMKLIRSFEQAVDALNGGRAVGP